MENENKNEQEEVMTFDLDNELDIKELTENVLNAGDFFKIDEGITYKIELTSPKITTIEKVFDDRTVNKFILQIKSINSKKVEYTGEWEVGSGVLKNIVANYEKGAVFKVSRTGTGLDTRYSVLKDF